MKMNKRMNRIFAITVGVLVFALIFQTIQLVPIATAHQVTAQQAAARQNNQMDGNNRMSCMAGSMSLEEMDKDDDGRCDICEMPISECAEMSEGHGETEGHGDMEDMMEEHHGMSDMHGVNGAHGHGMMGMSDMNCHM